MTIRIKVALGACAIGLWAMGDTAWAENRVALVVGNSAYQAVPALPNPANDARAMAGFLTSAGFDVMSTANLGQADMHKAISDFADKVTRAGTDTVALVYYAGHGVQIDGENFLVPVDARISREADVPLQALRLADLMNVLSSVPSRMRIVMLDACRNNPFSDINKTAGKGLAIVDAPVGSIVSYSTSPGSEAEDGAGENSPYTTALLTVGKEPGLPIEQAFKRARLSVNQSTAGRQTPWESSSLSSDFAFFPGAGGGKPVSPQPPKTPPAQAQAQSQPGAGPVKTVEIWKRDLRAVPAQRAYEIIILEDTIEAYEAYVALYGTPPLGPRVRSLLDRRNEMIAWYIAITVNSPVSIQAFLTKYPSSDLAATAARLLERARNRSLMASAAAGGAVAPTQLASANPNACSCSPAPSNKNNRRVSAPPPTIIVQQPPPRYYPVQPVGPPVRVDIGPRGPYGGGGFGGRSPGMNYPPPQMNNSPKMHTGPN